MKADDLKEECFASTKVEMMRKNFGSIRKDLALITEKFFRRDIIKKCSGKI
jgi:hypothetical protein